MKLLAVLGLALAVVAIDGPTSDTVAIYRKRTSDRLEPPMRRSQLSFKFLELDPSNPAIHLECSFKLFEFDPNRPDFCLKTLSKASGCKIKAAVDPKGIFPRISGWLETGGLFLPKNLLEMDVVRVAAFIFMFRVKGKEGAAECLYNFAMKKHFPAQFQMRLHKKLYTSNPLKKFENLETRPPEGLECLETVRERQLFFMLWTVQMCDKRKGDEDIRRARLLLCSEEVVLILAYMGVPLYVLSRGILQHQNEHPSIIPFYLLSDLQLMFLSFTRDEYLGLEEPEKTQLRVFLEKCFKYVWRKHSMLPNKLSEAELKQFEEIFGLECRIVCEHSVPGKVNEFAEFNELAKFNEFVECLYRLIRLRCPVFLLKKNFFLYLRKTSFTYEQALKKAHYFLGALTEARKMVEEDVDFETERVGEYPSKELVCSQIERTILECEEEINALPETFKVDPEVKEMFNQVRKRIEDPDRRKISC